MAAVEIAKPDTHRREYKFLELENGVKVVVASDDKCDMAGASACVNVGMCHERKDLPGLAHFLEHMLFTGTAKYPIEKEYSEFISQNGGTTNAYTTCYFTNYMFEVKPEKLVEALDRFGRFFSEPTLSRDCTEREVNAVDSEFQMGFTQPWWRLVGIFNMSANPDHPFHVACGNNKVLLNDPKEKGVDLYTEMRKLYDENYSANGLTVCIIGKESVAELEAIARERFGAVVNKGVTMPIGDSHGGDAVPFLPLEWHRLLLQNPVKDVKEFSLTWVIPYQAPKWRTKPSFYVSHLLGYEGKGSVIAALKDLGLITSCGTFDGAWLQGSFSLFSLQCDITDKGLTELKTIGKYFFAYIQMLQKVPVEKWIWDELSNLQKVKFKLGEDIGPFALSQHISAELQKLPPSEVLAGGELLYEYDPEGIKEIIDMLKLGSVRVSHQAKSLADRCTDKDTSYEAPMKFEAIPADWLAEWGEDLDAAALGLTLPSPNPFIPDDLSLRDLPAEPPAFPKRVESPPSPIAAILYRQDDIFRQPKAYVKIVIRSPYVMESAETMLKADMWCDCLKEELNVYSYDADVAGLSYNLTTSQGSIVLVLSGFNDKLGVLLNTVVEKMRSFTTIPESIFGLVADGYLDQLKNVCTHSAPYSQVSHRFADLADRGSNFPFDVQYEVFQKLKREDFDGMPAKLFDACHVEILALGNTTPADAKSLGEVLSKGLQIKNVLEAIPDRKEATLMPGTTVWKVDSTDADDPNNAVKLYMQFGVSDENKVMLWLLNAVLGTKFFDSLRTQQQLGYVCSLGPAVTAKHCYICVLVQTEFPLDFARSRIDAFLTEHITWIQETLTDEEFTTCREGVLSELKTKPKNLGEEAAHLTRAFNDRTYDFAARKRMIALLENSTTLETFRASVREKMPAASKLWIQVAKLDKKPNKELPEGAKVPEDPADITQWVGRDGVVEAFEKTTPGWAIWNGSSPDAWKACEV